MRRVKGNSMKVIVVALLAAAVFVPLGLRAEDKPAPSAPDAMQMGPGAPMVPGLGEIMSMQQMRHIKLWFAGNAANWPLADYEMGELGEGFDDVKKLLGDDIVDQHVGGPIAALQKAIDGKDRKAFVAAFDNLSAGCNACHKTLDHAFIAIQRPNMLPYSNQNFVPQK
jgi:hypothetical protein